MNSILKKGLCLVTISGMISAFPMTVHASVSNVDDIQPEIKNTGEYLDTAIADVETFLYIRSEPTKESEWVGKLYPGDAAKITGPVEDWTKVRFGSVNGYVCSDYIIVGNQAAEESKDENTNGQAIVDYACQFIGNPYVWGGTSLTNGADCSGFVQSVFAHFGISLPRTSGEMRSSGKAVSYEEIMPGDIVCYDGHVGIYMGEGQIVNAINSNRGIGVLSATYSSILTIRRMV